MPMTITLLRACTAMHSIQERNNQQSQKFSLVIVVIAAAEMLSPRGQHFGLGLGVETTASALSIWPRPGLGRTALALLTP